jgi:outer membrane protein TolC
MIHPLRRFLTGVLAGVLAVPVGSPVARAQETAPPAATEAQPEAVSLSLEEVLKAALEKNLDIAIRRIDPKIRETEITTEKSFFDPRIDASAEASEDNSPQTDPLTGAFVASSRDKTFFASYVDPFAIGSTLQFDVLSNRHFVGSTTYFTQAQARYTQPLLRNLGLDVNRTRITVAKNNETIGRSQFRQTVMNTLSDAEKAYWELNFALMDLTTKEASLQLARDFLDQTQVKVRVGTLPPIEITQAQAGVADREEAVIIAQNAVRTAEDNLRRLINIPPDSPAWGQPIVPSDEPTILDRMIDEQEAIKTALDRRPDLEQARTDLASREANLRYARNQRLYRLDFIGSYGSIGLAGDFSFTDFSDSVQQLTDRERTTWSTQLQLGIPLGNRSAEAAYSSARFQEDQARLSIQQLEQTARVEVRDAVRRIETNLKRVRAAQVNTKLQREKLDAEQKKYENGMSTTFQILQFQTDLTSAQSRENRAVVDYNQSLVDLDRILGILIDTRNVTLAE